MRKRITAVSVIIAVMLLLSGCGTTAVQNTKSYISNTKQILAQLFEDKTKVESNAEAVQETEKVRLDTPEEFTIKEDGSYSFLSVENASLYIMYLYDAENVDGDYLYSSNAIDENGARQYAGSMSDLVQVAYGKYVVKLQAVPELSDAEYAMSETAEADYVNSGRQDDPQIAYFWNMFDGTATFQLVNVSDYTYESYPEVELTMINTEDDSDVVTIALTNVTEDNYEVSTNELTRDCSYQISAIAKSDCEYVTNPVTEEIEVTASLQTGDMNVMSDTYICKDGIDDNRLNFPRAWDSLNLEEEGMAGYISHTIPAITTPREVSEGSVYSFDVLIQMPEIYLANGGYINPKNLHGSLELMEDGSFILTEDGEGPCPAGSISGLWRDNGDGTAALSYDPSTIVVG